MRDVENTGERGSTREETGSWARKREEGMVAE